MTDHPNLKPEDRALTRGEARKLWKQHGGTDAPALGPDVMTIPADQFHDFVAAIVARDEGRRAPGGGGDALVSTIEIALRNSLHWQNPDAVDKADHAIHLSGGVTPASSGCTLDLRDIAQSIADAIPTRDEAALPEAVATFQERVAPWMLACFGEEIAADRLERNDRFIEEALELCQANGYDATRAHQLVDYVFSRPVGEKWNEVGGVMVTLAALCNTIGVDIDEAADRELARIWTKVEQIREKQKSKPKGSALPVAAPPPPVTEVAGDVETVERFGDAIDAATRIHAWIDAVAAADNGKVQSREIRNYTFNEDDGGAVLYFRNNRVAADGFMVRDLHNHTVSMKVFADRVPSEAEEGR